MKKLLSTISLLFIVITLWSQPKEQMIKVFVSPDHTDWLYKPGETRKVQYQDNKEQYSVAKCRCLLRTFV